MELEAHEGRFIKKFIAKGNSIIWIPKDYTTREHLALPTNDFRWNKEEWELKSPMRKYLRNCYYNYLSTI